MKKKNTSGSGDGLSYEEEQLPYSDAEENEDEQDYYDDEYYDDYDDEPVRKKGKSLKHTVIYMLVVLGLSLLLAVVMWFAADDILALTKPDNVITITVSEDDTLDDVAQNLKDPFEMLIHVTLRL